MFKRAYLAPVIAAVALASAASTSIAQQRPGPNLPIPSVELAIGFGAGTFGDGTLIQVDALYLDAKVGPIQRSENRGSVLINRVRLMGCDVSVTDEKLCELTVDCGSGRVFTINNQGELNGEVPAAGLFDTQCVKLPGDPEEPA